MAYLNLIIQLKLFDQWLKGKVKGSKNFTLLYTCDLYTKEPIYHRPYQGNMLDYYVEDFWKRLNGEKLLING
ncbi:hypothetical protein HYE22_02885 [Mycoplasmopsis bovis]|nr:hypothetical protein [Mycoplasmopsis bovis]QQH24157.1 hypothetical protein HYE22_02885 [Mycoplasmopsis bovis]